MRQEFSIVSRRGKNGSVYYVRFFENNKMIPSQWSARTGDYEEAVCFARANKEKILKKYFNRKEGKVLYSVLENYYAKESPYLVIDTARGRKINETSRRILHGFIVNTFLPFLRKSNIKEFDEITPVVMSRFQNYLLLEKKLLPQSINRQISGIKAVFSHMFMTGIIEKNVIKDISPLRSRRTKIRNCYSIDDLAGIFGEQWKDKKSYLFCFLIYSTGLRNSEIQNLKVKDIIFIKDICFLNITKSKTQGGVRIIPLHPKTRETLEQWIQENKLAEDNYIFIKKDGQRIFKAAKKANIFLGSILGKSPEDLEKENITFYSGRHFYKTMLNLYSLGDIEELFMGHKVDRRVSERYNHKDKRGETALLAEARHVIEIIDTVLLRPSAPCDDRT